MLSPLIRIIMIGLTVVSVATGGFALFKGAQASRSKEALKTAQSAMAVVHGINADMASQIIERDQAIQAERERGDQLSDDLEDARRDARQIRSQLNRTITESNRELRRAFNDDESCKAWADTPACGAALERLLESYDNANGASRRPSDIRADPNPG